MSIESGSSLVVACNVARSDVENFKLLFVKSKESLSQQSASGDHSPQDSGSDKAPKAAKFDHLIDDFYGLHFASPSEARVAKLLMIQNGYKAIGISDWKLITITTSCNSATCADVWAAVSTSTPLDFVVLRLLDRGDIDDLDESHTHTSKSDDNSKTKFLAAVSSGSLSPSGDRLLDPTFDLNLPHFNTLVRSGYYGFENFLPKVMRKLCLEPIDAEENHGSRPKSRRITSAKEHLLLSTIITGSFLTPLGTPRQDSTAYIREALLSRDAGSPSVERSNSGLAYSYPSTVPRTYNVCTGDKGFVVNGWRESKNKSWSRGNGLGQIPTPEEFAEIAADVVAAAKNRNLRRMSTLDPKAPEFHPLCADDCAAVYTTEAKRIAKKIMHFEILDILKNSPDHSATVATISKSLADSRRQRFGEASPAKLRGTSDQKAPSDPVLALQDYASGTLGFVSIQSMIEGLVASHVIFLSRSPTSKDSAVNSAASPSKVAADAALLSDVKIQLKNPESIPTSHLRFVQCLVIAVACKAIEQKSGSLSCEGSSATLLTGKLDADRKPTGDSGAQENTRDANSAGRPVKEMGSVPISAFRLIWLLRLECVMPLKVLFIILQVSCLRDAISSITELSWKSNDGKCTDDANQSPDVAGNGSESNAEIAVLFTEVNGSFPMPQDVNAALTLLNESERLGATGPTDQPPIRNDSSDYRLHMDPRRPINSRISPQGGRQAPIPPPPPMPSGAISPTQTFSGIHQMDKQQLYQSSAANLHTQNRASPRPRLHSHSSFGFGGSRTSPSRPLVHSPSIPDAAIGIPGYHRAGSADGGRPNQRFPFPRSFNSPNTFDNSHGVTGRSPLGAPLGARQRASPTSDPISIDVAQLFHSSPPPSIDPPICTGTFFAESLEVESYIESLSSTTRHSARDGAASAGELNRIFQKLKINQRPPPEVNITAAVKSCFTA